MPAVALGSGRERRLGNVEVDGFRQNGGPANSAGMPAALAGESSLTHLVVAVVLVAGVFVVVAASLMLAAGGDT